VQQLNPIAIFNGCPFIDKSFNHIALLTAVCSVRQFLAIQIGWEKQELKEFLDPLSACLISDHFQPAHPPVQSRALSASELCSVNAAIESIESWRPEWKHLFRIPVRVRYCLELNIMRMTNPSIPQHVFLGEESFSTPADLEETLVHEFSHLWLGLIGEIWRLHDVAVPGIFTLPSGTGGKTGTGVLLSALFAAAVIEFYGPRRQDFQGRIDYLADYLSGCIDLLHEFSGLTFAGKAVYERLLNYRNVLKSEVFGQT